MSDTPNQRVDDLVQALADSLEAAKAKSATRAAHTPVSADADAGKGDDSGETSTGLLPGFQRVTLQGPFGTAIACTRCGALIHDQQRHQEVCTP